MKQGIYITIWLICFLSLSSCTRQHNHNILLMQADSLMEEYPDSALCILESIKSQQLTAQADHAYYALLLTQARDKNYIVQTDDSLIRMAVQYYDSIEDISMQAKAHYYKGCIYRDANLCGKAVQEYLIAITFAKEAENQRLQGLVYNHAGYLYYLQDLLEQADSIYQLTERLAIQQNDTILWADALLFQGKINIERGIPYYPKAEEKLLEAFEISIPNYNRIRANIAASLSTLYSLMNQHEKAIQFAKLNIALQNDTTHCYKAFSILGYAYFKAEQDDSATLYINKSLASEMYDIKANAYMLLADMTKRQGDVDKSLALTEKQLLYTDSINLSQQSNDILNAEQEVERQRHIKQLNNQHSKQTVLITVSLLSIFIIGVICFLLKKYRRDTHNLKLQQFYLEQEKQKLQQEHMLLKSKLALKDSEITSLKESIRQQQISEAEKERLQQELELFSKERDTLAKEAFEHSEIHAKMERIIASCKKCGKSNEAMNEEDWKYLMAETNMRWNGAITRLDSQYQLSKKEIHLCCLYLTDIPIANLEYLIEYRRSSIYRKEKDILALMGYSSHSCKLKDILKEI